MAVCDWWRCLHCTQSFQRITTQDSLVSFLLDQTEKCSLLRATPLFSRIIWFKLENNMLTWFNCYQIILKHLRVGVAFQIFDPYSDTGDNWKLCNSVFSAKAVRLNTNEIHVAEKPVHQSGKDVACLLQIWPVNLWAWVLWASWKQECQTEVFL